MLLKTRIMSARSIWILLFVTVIVVCTSEVESYRISWRDVGITTRISHRRSRHGTPSSLLFMMATRDGKKNRHSSSSNAKANGIDTSTIKNDMAASKPPPQRVDSNINIPVRRQIEWARAKKEAMQMTNGSFRAKNVKTAYRKKLDPEREEEKKLERAQRGHEPDWDVILNVTATPPLLIVDAYNVIHQWPRLKKWMRKGDTYRARNLLVQDLETLSSVKGWRIEVVFDGAGRSTTGPLDDTTASNNGEEEKKKISLVDQQAKMSLTDNGSVRIVYSGAGCSADSYIEKRCLDAKKVTDGKCTRSLIVASNDNMVRLAGQNAGALCMSSDRFIVELKALHNIVAYKLEAAVAMFNGHEIRDDPKLWGTPNTYGRQQTQIIIEDKRKKKDHAATIGDGEDGAIPDVNLPLPYGRRTQFIIVDKRKKSNKDTSSEDHEAKAKHSAGIPYNEQPYNGRQLQIPIEDKRKRNKKGSNNSTLQSLR
mmetsp:Transcript_4453/g.6608  ORF Transcript_4453/g.6608 Transcript_4453/m.6608 type:complete len:481 (-) Transcript_4453:2015-3457(-)